MGGTPGEYRLSGTVVLYALTRGDVHGQGYGQDDTDKPVVWGAAGIPLARGASGD